MVDWVTHYDTIYDALGVTARLSPAASGGPADVTVIDKTTGVAVDGLSQIGVQTVVPVAAVRCTELAEKSIDPNGCDGGTIEFNDRQWKVSSHILKPAPTGEGKGEVYLLLSER